MIIVAVAAILSQADLGPPEVLQRSFVVRSEWSACVSRQAVSYASLAEEANVIVDAAMAKCSDREPAFRAVVEQLTINSEGMRFNEQSLTELMSRERQKVRGTALTALLDARLSAKQGRK